MNAVILLAIAAFLGALLGCLLQPLFTRAYRFTGGWVAALPVIRRHSRAEALRNLEIQSLEAEIADLGDLLHQEVLAHKQTVMNAAVAEEIRSYRKEDVETADYMAYLEAVHAEAVLLPINPPSGGAE